MDKQLQSAPLWGRMYKGDTAKPREKQILVLKTGIAGVQHHIESEEERNALNALTPGTELLLYREPENEYDEWAVAVYLTETDKLGFITRFKNETIARLMDAGKKFTAVVDEFEQLYEAEAEKDGTRRHRRAPTENMSIPFSVYLTEEE